MSAKRFLIAAFLSASAFAGADVHIDENIPYRDKEEIDNRIVSECLEVGSIMSESLRESAAKKRGNRRARWSETRHLRRHRHHFRHERRQCLCGTRQGLGCFCDFVYWRQQVKKTTLSRNSMGGMFGGFKGSCSVLNRTAKVLGADLAKWIIQEQKNAQAK